MTNVTAYTDTELTDLLSTLTEGDYFPHNSRNAIRAIRSGSDRNGYKSTYTDTELRDVARRHYIFD